MEAARIWWLPRSLKNDTAGAAPGRYRRFAAPKLRARNIGAPGEGTKPDCLVPEHRFSCAARQAALRCVVTQSDPQYVEQVRWLGQSMLFQIPDGIDAGLVIDTLPAVAVNPIVRLSTGEEDAKGVTNMLGPVFS
jgi:hypothetical protein